MGPLRYGRDISMSRMGPKLELAGILSDGMFMHEMVLLMHRHWRGKHRANAISLTFVNGAIRVTPDVHFFRNVFLTGRF